MLSSSSRTIRFSGTPQIAQFPTIESSTDDFSFGLNSPFGVFGVEAHWVNNVWKLYFTLPSGTIRETSLLPGVLIWAEFSDYSLMFYPTSFTEVAHDDISGTLIRIFKR